VVVEDGCEHARRDPTRVACRRVRAFVFESAEALLADTTLCAVCLIVDVRLPRLSGWELVERLRKRGPLPPVVFVSAHRDALKRIREMVTATHVILMKPFTGRELLAAVQRALSR
jgi:two-component system, LuxR family, response regulator FixJ